MRQPVLDKKKVLVGWRGSSLLIELLDPLERRGGPFHQASHGEWLCEEAIHTREHCCLNGGSVGLTRHHQNADAIHVALGALKVPKDPSKHNTRQSRHEMVNDDEMRWRTDRPLMQRSHGALGLADFSHAGLEDSANYLTDLTIIVDN